MQTCFGLLLLVSVRACTNFLVTKGASEDGTNQVSYNADAGNMYGTLYHSPAGKHAQGEKIQIFDWDGGFYLGEIDQASETYNVIGNINEHQVVITETTFGGLPKLQGHGIIDYGTLIYIVLARSKSAQQAIEMIVELTQKWGYASNGESFSISDPDEIWYMELIGKGQGENGLVWIAKRIPDGYVGGSANQARIGVLGECDPVDCMHSGAEHGGGETPWDFALRTGLVNASEATIDTFSFRDVFDPLTFSGMRQAEARVWDTFHRVAPDMEKYLPYALGYNSTIRLPLFVKASKKISLEQHLHLMRSHYDNTPLNMTDDVAAGDYSSAFRATPIQWKVGNETYINERPIATQQTGWHLVAQTGAIHQRDGAVMWFGTDDSSFSVSVPFFCSTLRVPNSFADGNGDLLHFSSTASFWVNNQLANFIYGRYDLAPVVWNRITEIQRGYRSQLPGLRARAATMDAQAAAEMLTEWSVTQSEELVKTWNDLYHHLLVSFRDGEVITAVPHMPDHGGLFGGVVPKEEDGGYDQRVYERIAKSSFGKHLQVPNGAKIDPSGPASDKKNDHLDKNPPVLGTIAVEVEGIDLDQHKRNVINGRIHHAPPARESQPIIV